MRSTMRTGRRPLVFVALLLVAAFAVALLAQPAAKPGPELAAPGGPNGTANAIDASAGPGGVGNGVQQGKAYKHDKTPKPLRETAQVGNKPRDEDEEEDLLHRNSQPVGFFSPPAIVSRMEVSA